VWSPEGTRIAFVSERDGNAEVYVMLMAGTGQTRLTSDGAADAPVAWVP
jgi:Tol biopolymer transport system component